MDNYKKVNFFSIILFVSCFLLIFSPYISQRVNNVIKISLEFFILILLFLRKKIDAKSFKAIIPTIIFFLFTLYSTFRASGFSTRLVNSFVTSGAFVILFYVIYICNKYITKEKIISVIKKYFFFFTIIMDILAIFTWGKGLGGLRESVYLFGNKFLITYCHMFYFSSLVFNYKKNNLNNILIMLLYFIYSIFILKLVDTTTGIIGIFSIAFFLLLGRDSKLIHKLSNPKVLIIFIVITNSIFLLSDILISNRLVYSFLLKYSHTDSLLSGRLPMYSLVLKSIKNNFLFGYGINYDIVMESFGFGNPQNGILKMLLDYGLCGTISFLIICYSSFKKLNDFNNKDLIYFLVPFIYAMFICSLVEINIDTIFMLGLALCNGLSYSIPKKGE